MTFAVVSELGRFPFVYPVSPMLSERHGEIFISAQGSVILQKDLSRASGDSVCLCVCVFVCVHVCPHAHIHIHRGNNKQFYKNIFLVSLNKQTNFNQWLVSSYETF